MWWIYENILQEFLLENNVGIFLALIPAIYFFRKDLSKIKRNIAKIKNNVIEMQGYLNGKFGADFISAKSPMELTEKGVEIAKAIKADIISSKYLDKVKYEENANAYEIQEICFEFARQELQSQLDGKELDAIQLEAYERGIRLKNILDIIAIVIRDEILKKLKIQPADIDKHAPKK